MLRLRTTEVALPPSKRATGLRVWAIKPGELRPLSRAGLLLFSARCAMRVAPWRVPSAAARWDGDLAFLVARAFDRAETPPSLAEVRRQSRALQEVGARECNRLEAVDEPLGRCHSYAHGTLVEAVLATALTERQALVKTTIVCAKLSASIAAIQAHAGRVVVPPGQRPVDVACTTTWDAIRADVGPVASALDGLAATPAADRVEALRRIAPLWPGHTPSWATPS